MVGEMSYAQSGEDLIARFILDALRVTRPNYLDLGAYDPVRLSNTYHFYARNSRGVCVEADPGLASRFAEVRPRDRVINVAVSDHTSGRAKFFAMSEASLNTLSQAEAERLVREEGCTIRTTLDVDIVPVATLIAREFPSRVLDFLSIDLEGIDEQIIAGIDFNFLRPKVICVETLSYSRLGGQVKKTGTIDMLRQRGYKIYADTYINTIAVDAELWHSRT